MKIKTNTGRSLRDMYIWRIGTFINAKIIEEGYANVYNAANVSKIIEFRRLEKSS